MSRLKISKTKMKTKSQANAVYQTCLLLVCSFPKLFVRLSMREWHLGVELYKAAPKDLAGYAEDSLS